MKKFIKYFLVAFLFVLLVLVRAFSSDLFYDPLKSYFEEEYLYISPEGIDNWKLLTNMFFRYVINTTISLAIIWLIFKRKSFVKFSILFYAIAFVILNAILFYLLSTDFSSGHLFPFYIRRFIIHPVILLILLPAFYYQILQEREV